MYIIPIIFYCMARHDGVPKRPKPDRYTQAAAVEYVFAELQKTRADLYTALKAVMRLAEDMARQHGTPDNDVIFEGYAAVERTIRELYPEVAELLDAQYQRVGVRRMQRAMGTKPATAHDTVGGAPVRMGDISAPARPTTGPRAELDRTTRDRAVAVNLLLAHLQETGHPAFAELAELMRNARETAQGGNIHGTPSHVIGHIAVERAVRAQHPDLISLLENPPQPSHRTPAPVAESAVYAKPVDRKPEPVKLDPEVERRNRELSPHAALEGAHVLGAIRTVINELRQTDPEFAERIVATQSQAEADAKAKGLSAVNQVIDANNAVAAFLHTENRRDIFDRVMSELEKR